MNAYATKLSEGFSQRLTKYFFQTAVSDKITNNDYEGEIKDQKSKLDIMTFGKIALKNFTGANMTADDVYESIGELVTDQQKAHYFKIHSLDQFKSWIKNPEGTLLEQVGNTLKETIDAYNLGFYTDVAAGNRVGTDYSTGTVTVDVTTGAVTGSGTTFTAAMVGRGFKATGHTAWYRVKSFASTTSIVIEDDSDDLTSAYTGGAIAGGTAYVIEAPTSIQMTKTTAYGQIVSLKTKLDKAKIPASDRWLVMPADLSNLLLQAGEVTPAVDSAYEEVIKRGLVGTISGFQLYSNEQVSGDGTNGYHVLAGHRSAITFAMGMTESGIEDLNGNFGKAYKGLNVYGGKVVDERRKALAEGYFKL